MDLKESAKKRLLAIRAINQMKAKLSQYPSIAAVGLGKENNKFVVLLFVYRDDLKKISADSCKIPKLIYVKDLENGGKTVKVPTLIEQVDHAELMIAV